MAKPKRSKPGIRLFVTTDLEIAERLRALEVVATNESGASVSASTLHARGMPAMLAALESCAQCRAGKCDGSAHARPDNSEGLKVRRDEQVGDRSIAKTVEQTTVPKSVETNVSAVGQVAMFEPPAKEKPKRAPKKVTTESPEHARIVDVYHLEFGRVRGEKPAYTPRDFAAFRKLLKEQGFDRGCDLIKNAFADPFWSKRVTIRKIADDPSLFAGAPKTAEPRPRSTQDEPLPEGWV